MLKYPLHCLATTSMSKKELFNGLLLVVITIIIQFIMKDDYILLFLYVWYSYVLSALLINKVQFSFKYGIGLALVAVIYVIGASMLSGYILLDLIIKGICPTLISFINRNVPQNLTWLEKETLAYEQYCCLYKQGYINENKDRLEFHFTRKSGKDVINMSQRVRE